MKICRLIRSFNRSYSTPVIKSSLVVIGEGGSKVSRTIIPDLQPENEQKYSAENIRRNLKARGINEKDLFGVSPENVQQSLKKYLAIRKQLADLEQEREAFKEIAAKDVTKRGDMKLLKKKIKSTQAEFWTQEDDCLHRLIVVPNSLDPQTPEKEDTILHEHEGCRPPTRIAAKDVEFEEGNPLNVFIKGQCALEETKLLRRAQLFLQKDGFSDIIAPPDIVRSTVIEGCDPLSFGDPNRSLALSKSSDFGDLKSGLGAHLVGSASFPGLVTFFVKNVLANRNVLPLNYISIGRQYYPAKPASTASLLNTQQSSCVGLLSLNADSATLDQSFEEWTAKFKTFYDDLGLGYRLVYKAAKDLSLPESLRLEAQVWSEQNNCHVCVGSLSKYDDFVSQRLLIKYQDSEDELKPLHLLSGTFLDVHKYFGCII